MPPPVALPSPPPVPSWSLVNEPQAGFRVHHSTPWGLALALPRPTIVIHFPLVAFVSIMASPAELQQTIIAFVKKGLYADALARTNERTWP